MQVVVLAGGLATRLYPLTKDIPKSMVLVNGRPFLYHQIQLFKKNNLKDVVLCVGHLSEQIKNYFGDGSGFGVNITYSQETEKLDTGGAIKNAKPYLQEEFFIIYGDSYLRADYRAVYKFFKQINTQGLMTVYKNDHRIEPSTIYVTNNLITKFSKEYPEASMQHMEYGLNILKMEVLDRIDKRVFPIGEYFEVLIGKSQLAAYEVKERFYEIGSPEGLKELEQQLHRKN